LCSIIKNEGAAVRAFTGIDMVLNPPRNFLNTPTTPDAKMEAKHGLVAKN